MIVTNLQPLVYTSDGSGIFALLGLHNLSWPIQWDIYEVECDSLKRAGPQRLLPGAPFTSID